MTTPPIIPGFRIEGLSGTGSHATVWSAIQESIGRRIALKVFHRDLGLDTEPLFREARLAGSIHSPHVVQVHDCGQYGEWCYIAQEWIDGVDAQRLLEQHGGRLPIPEAVRIIHAAAIGAAAIADAGLVHRDIKPSNIMVTTRGDVKLTDLGTALHQIGGRTVSATGVVMGTPAFMAPEQARGDVAIDVRCDVYALGATLFTLVTGIPFVGGDSALAVMTRVATTPAPDLRERAPWLPPEIAYIIRAATAFDRRQRLAHPTLLAEDCAALLREEQPAHAGAVCAKSRIRLRRLAVGWLIPIAICALIIGSILGFTEGRRSQRVPTDILSARAHPTISAWQAIASNTNGEYSHEAERVLGLLRTIQGLSVTPTIARSDLSELEPLRAEISKLDSDVAHAKQEVAAATTAVMAAEEAAKIQRKATENIPALPEMVDLDLITERLTTATLPAAASAKRMYDFGQDIRVLYNDAIRLSRDGGKEWSVIPTSTRYSGLSCSGDVLICRNFGDRPHILQNDHWTVLPWQDGKVPDAFGRELSGRWLAVRREGNRRPGPGIIWKSTNDGQTWTELAREEQLMTFRACPDGLVITAWRGRKEGTWILYPGSEAFVRIADHGKGWAWQQTFNLDGELVFLPPDKNQLLRRDSAGETTLSPCGLPANGDLEDLIVMGEPSRWYAWTRPQGILRSLDQGRTWYASVGPLEKLGQSIGTFVRWGPQRDLLLFALHDAPVAPIVLDDRDGHPALFPATIEP